MFSKSCRYAIRAVLYLAVHSNEETKLGVKDIAEELSVPKHFLAKLLQQLSRNRIISSSKGPSGGFFLNESNTKNSLLEVIECIDGPDIFGQCVLGLPECSSNNPCTLHHEVIRYKDGLVHLLENETINESAERILNQGLKL